MRYFKTIPNISYSGETLKNIFYSFRLEDVDTKYLIEYRMSNGETLFSVSQTLYGTQDYWWLIAVINGIYDIYFDIALSNTVIQEIADDELSDGYSASDLLLKYDELTAENDDKRVIKVINPPDIKRVLLTILKAK